MCAKIHGEMFFRLVLTVGCPAVIVELKARAAATSYSFPIPAGVSPAP